MIQAGNYEGKAVEGKVQFGETGGGTLQIAIDMELFDAKNQSVGNMTTFLYFTEKNAVYSFERLRALGWKGTGPDDLANLGDIYSTRVPCRVSAPEPYDDPVTKERKLGMSKLEIMTGAGTVQLQKPLEKSTFISRMKAILGGGGSSPNNSGGGTPPPF